MIKANYLMLTLCLNETIDQLAMANSMHWYGHVLGGHFLRSVLEFEVFVKGI